ncbi:Heavy-metal-associated domain-containing protein [Rhodovastum atsumiense]|uniref:Heavy-metal-associated domain-containing protein n=1 Tax=Rhodovastum atsumiense TaxID=504468 RepID=A0A5M6IUS7_9PROT|nr:heavy-metal-associated domain-containing protein [Rhodovastum atsumiense]KAA5612063.1 heavy-metal-associated domain-containing protein [Rhodovastum atsumiense]CAH2604069.1 Heavy-metal-associated domain-containing protein [Rhodovastum atsumiense]
MPRFSVPDMSCNGCVRSITGAVQGVDPAARVEADLDTHLVTIDSQAAPAALQAAITEAGFTVTPAA